MHPGLDGQHRSQVFDLLHSKKQELLIADRGPHAVEVRGATSMAAASPEEALKVSDPLGA